MLSYEHERPRSSVSTSSRATAPAEWGRSQPRIEPGTQRFAGRALPPRPPVICGQMHETKPTVPLKVWIVASASCFAVCAILVLATVAILKWGTNETYPDTNGFYSESNTQHTSHKSAPSKLLKTTEPPADFDPLPSEEDTDDIKYPILEKLGIFKNIVANREMSEKKDSLMHKPQIYPERDATVHHAERKIEKKDHPKPLQVANNKKPIPEFKPTLPGIQFPDGYVRYTGDLYEDYAYNDDNLYEDYIQSTSMTSYLIEKVQELHDWIASDSDFDIFDGVANGTQSRGSGNEFSQVLQALNESIVEGNITIIMNKLKDIYYGDNYTVNNNRKIILTNRTDLLSFGILTLDVMLLHNIQLMAWESQESVRTKMLRDPDVFAFNALFMDPTKVEAKQKEILHHHDSAIAFPSKRQNHRQDVDELPIGKNILENMLELGMSTARAAIHLGRTYKNTKLLLNQLSTMNRENINANIQAQVSRNVDGNTRALNHLQTSYKNGSDSGADATGAGAGAYYTELDCVWLLYCKNLAATGKLNPPYGVMARINGVALRMLAGELSADKAIDTLLYEALTGWTDLRCLDMFPRCSKRNAASVVLESIVQPIKKPNKF